VEPLKNHSENNLSTYRESTKSRNYKKQPHWTLHKCCGNYCC